MSIKDPKHNRLYAIACLTDELARIRNKPIEERVYAHTDVVHLATALYELATREAQWQEDHPEEGIKVGDWSRSDA